MATADRRAWRTSSRTNNGQACVEVAPTAAGILVRDSKDHGTGPVLIFTHDEWAAFLAHPITDIADLVTRHDGVDVPTRRRLRDTLHFTEGEWDAFLAGARSGEFDFADEPKRVAVSAR